MDHGVRAAGEHDVGLAAADDLDRLANGLAAGRAGGEAVEIRSLGIEEAGQMRGRHVRLLLQFRDRVEHFQAPAGETADIQLRTAVQSGDHHFGKAVEVLRAFPAAGVNAEAGGIQRGVLQAGVADGFLGGPDGKTGVTTLILPVGRVQSHVGEVPVADLGRYSCRKIGGIKEGRIAYARLASEQPLPNAFAVGAQGRDQADAGDDDTSSHGSLPFCEWAGCRSLPLPLALHSRSGGTSGLPSAA